MTQILVCATNCVLQQCNIFESEKEKMFSSFKRSGPSDAESGESDSDIVEVLYRRTASTENEITSAKQMESSSKSSPPDSRQNRNSSVASASSTRWNDAAPDVVQVHEHFDVMGNGGSEVIAATCGGIICTMCSISRTLVTVETQQKVLSEILVVTTVIRINTCQSTSISISSSSSGSSAYYIRDFRLVPKIKSGGQQQGQMMGNQQGKQGSMMNENQKSRSNMGNNMVNQQLKGNSMAMSMLCQHRFGNCQSKKPTVCIESHTKYFRQSKLIVRANSKFHSEMILNLQKVATASWVSRKIRARKRSNNSKFRTN